jgi:hypothetical protein
MNTYIKYQPNVFLAKCTEKHEKGKVILVTTQYGKENECIVFNLISEKDGFYFYSIVRADGFNVQEWIKKRAAKYEGYAASAEKRRMEYYHKSNKDSDFLRLGEPIKVGHHSERRHRKIIKQAQDNATKSVEFSDKAKQYESKAEDWLFKADTINLSMPESLEYYEHKLEQARAKHEGLKAGTIKREHSYSMTYAKKEVNELQKKLDLAKKLWL